VRIGYIGIKGLPSKAGADRVVEAIVQRLANKHEVTVYCSPLIVPAETIYPGVELVRVPVLRGKHLHATTLFITSAIHALSRNYDLIHIHNLEASFVLPLLKIKYKVIATSHGSLGVRKKWGRVASLGFRLAWWPTRMADCITTVSKREIDTLERRYNQPIRYIPNGVDINADSADLEKAREFLLSHQVDQGKYILFAAGRIIPTKGAGILLQAYRNLATEQKLLVVGDFSHMPEHEFELRQLADPRVIFIPFIDKATLLGLVHQASIFVFPSTHEAMSMMLLEAAMQEASIISSDIQANTIVLPHHALYFKSGDSNDLLEKMDWALHHPDHMRKLGIGAKAWVLEKYQWDSIVPQYEQLYKILVKNADCKKIWQIK